MNKSYLIVLLSALSGAYLFPGNATAQQIILGGGSNPQLIQAQGLLLEADSKAANRDYKSAESLYSQAIAVDGNNLDAYLQRGIVRRELGNAAGTQADGQMSIALANAALKDRPSDPNLYYKRGMGFSLVKNYQQAEQDISTGIKLGGPSSWKTDLEAVALEQKEDQ